MNQNNELEVLSFLNECIIPSQKIIHNGGNVNGADFIVVDSDDPAPPTETIKAHYVIAGNSLFMHSTNIDPWNMMGAAGEAGLPVETIRDRKITITKRPGGARRTNSTSGPLMPGDYRDCAFAIRFWPQYPKKALDLKNSDHQEIIKAMLHEIKREQGFVPHVTIDAKKNKQAQCVGPTVGVKVIGDDVNITLTGKEIGGGARIESFLTNDTVIRSKFHNFMTTLGIDETPFKIVHKGGSKGVPEDKYKQHKFYETYAEDFELSSATFRKQITIR